VIADLPQHALRVAGLRRAFAADGLSLDDAKVFARTSDDAAGGYAAARAALAADPGLTAIFATHDILAVGAVEAVIRSGRPTRKAFTFLDGDGERTITVFGDKLRPSGSDGNLPWEELIEADAAFFVSGDEAALRAARRAPILVATAREIDTLRDAAVELDALVGSGEDPGERYGPGELEPRPRLVVTTAGALGGWMNPGGPYLAAPLPGPVEDAYGCGDCFGAGLTFGLASGLSPEEAVELAARCGAAVLTGRGAYTAQLTL